MNEVGLTRNRIISELARSTHKKLDEYVPAAQRAIAEQPEFLAHLIAWNFEKGQIRDSKAALPIITLTFQEPELLENSLAHLAKLDPRELLKAYKFGLQLKPASRMGVLRRLASAYLRELESSGNWERRALQHRAVLKTLYALTHTKPSARADAVLFKNDYTNASLFASVKRLPVMSISEAAGTILERKIPFLIARGALGAKLKEPDLVLALLKGMSPTEVITNTKMFERLGVKTHPALRSAFEEALQRTSTSKANILKTTKAAEQIDDTVLKQKLLNVQEKQIAAMAVEGDWLVLGDKSGSMTHCIEASRHIAATLAGFVKGKVWLVFFDTETQAIDVTGASLDTIRAATKYITANGGTSIGCGLQRMLDSNIVVDGIAIVSDGCENQPPAFWSVYERYSKTIDKEVPVYFYRLHGNEHYYGQFTNQTKYAVTEFDLSNLGTIDYYSLPNLVTTMRTNRYSLIDEIMDWKLLKLSSVLTGLDNRVEDILGKGVHA